MSTDAEKILNTIFTLFILAGKKEEFITVCPDPRHTKYYWGDISEIAGKRLKVLDHATNGCGNCLCYSDKGLVDVKHEDIVK